MVRTTYHHQSLEKVFDEDVKTLQSTLSPGSPGIVGQKVVEDEDKVTEKGKLYIDLEWEHCCISQNIPDQI